MHIEGASKKSVSDKLKQIRKQDQMYDNGRILCSMCTKPHPIAQKAYEMFLNSNLGDPGLFPGSVKLEKEVINQLATLLHGKKCSGFIVSGGTEANLMALLAARNMARVDQPEVVLPESAHFSFTKICKMLNIKPVYASIDGSFRVDPSSVEKCVSKNTIAIIGTAGTAELGVVDPMEKLSRIAREHNLYFHVDAAFGGLVIPFLANVKIDFDFNLPTVQSITVDPHKMGMAAIPAGGIIFRNSETLDSIKTETTYLTDQFQYTVAGTRSGGSAASAWAVFNHLGVVGFKKIVGKCVINSKFLADGLVNSGFQLVTEPPLNIVAFRTQNTKRLAENLWQKGWFVSYVPRYDCIRIVLMPHVKKRHVLAFLKEVNETQKL